MYSKRILHIIPYRNLYPPKNGGQLRCFHLMDELSKHFQMDVLCYQSASSILANGYKNEHIRFYSPHSFVKNEGLFKFLPTRLKNALRYRFLTKTLFQSATMEVLEFEHIVKELSKSNAYETIVFEHLSAMSLLPIIKKYFLKAKYVLDAHNVDHLLIDQNNPSIEKQYIKIKKLESSLYKNVHEFWACSKNDVNILESLNNNKIQGKVVPNGVDLEAKSYVDDKSNTYNTILFCGTLDANANKEGILWFYKNIWPCIIKKKSDVKLLVVGKGDRTPFLDLESDATVDFIGEVEDVAPYYKKSFIAIVPLLSGSGTRLKILEAMSFGNPIVSTSKGIEGIEFENGNHALIANTTDDFSSNIIQILDVPKKGDQLRENAYKLVKDKYDWGIIVNNLVKEYDS